MNFVAASLYTVSSSTLLALVLALLRGTLTPAIAACALAGGLLAAAVVLWRERHAVRPARIAPGVWEWAALVAFALVSLRIFLWVVFIEGDEIKVLSPNNLGDLSLHLTYIRFLASGASFWPENPIFAGAPLVYPIGVDLFHSLLALLGVDVLRGFVWIGLAGSALTGAALWQWGRGIAVFGFLANGGLAALTIFSTGELVDFQSEHAWKSFALALFATQRGLLFALPAGLLLLSSWRSRFFRPEGQPLSRGGEVLLYASLPLFHFHTFLFLSALLAFWFVSQASARGDLLRLVGAALLPATALVFLVTGGLQGGQSLGWKPGWMWDDPAFLTWCRAHFQTSERVAAAWLFWPINFGLLPLFTGALLWRLRRDPDPWPRAMVLPAVGIFLVCCFAKFAIWEWDNTKLMVWSYLAILPFLWSKLVGRWPAPIRLAAGVALFGSGFLSTLGGLSGAHRGHAIASRAELAGTAHAVRAIPVTARFAGAPTYNHPLLLNGRKMVLGYLGHVSSHGLAWQAPAAKLDAFLHGPPDWRVRAGELGVRYLFWGKNEEEAYADSAQPWRDEARVFAAGEWGTIYDLNTPAEPR